MEMQTPTLIRIKNGWPARGDGWAVRASSEEEAVRVFNERDAWRAEVDARVPRRVGDETRHLA